MRTRIASTALAAALAVAALATPSVASAPQPGMAATAPDETIDSPEDLQRVLAHFDSVHPNRRAEAQQERAERSQEAIGEVSASGPLLNRIAGSNRYETAVKISQDSLPSPVGPWSGILYVTNGMNFPDALSAGPAAASSDSPILLVPPTGPLPSVVRDEVKRLRPIQIYVLGQTDSVSAQAFNELKALVADHNGYVYRWAGPNRFMTSAYLASAVVNVDVDTGIPIPPDTLIVANGMTYADALAGGAAGAYETAPLLLVRPDRLEPNIAGYIAPQPYDPAVGLPAQEYTTVRILGSRASVSDAVVAQLKKILPRAEFIRYSGRDRFETAALLNDDVFEYAGVEVTLTNGLRFPDALAAAPRAAFTWGPTVLTRDACLPVVSAESIDTFEPWVITALGGVDAVSDAALSGTVCP